MGYKFIRYSVKDSELEANRALVAKVFEALDETAPQGVRYLVLELDDGEFIHIVGEGHVVGAGNDASGLTGLAAFEAFTQNHAARRSTPVQRSPVRIIGNYHVLEDGKAG
ncbi:hypothetical protein OHD62_22900 [Mesorhizobium sp. YC-39]|uniref:hypothetical protein n=1 Tax=unclassified Mesorhizobium TaxID=325217 RepID=UPI0021E99561|nr:MULTISPECIES: hypothetical protein [unclassified Mesorhizobium]MCV3209418.1 hypothetical protein [Mesorhizobium sp. YC-2]MCV3231232.1 hypothetical protein [Mesorhizobium sp. YC-39]